MSGKELISNTILVVDDDDGIRETLSDIFQESGFHVLTAQDGKTAKERVNSTNVNLALLDIKLPDTDGIALLKEIKGINPRCACIIITGNASLQNATNALKDGADGYFVKPIGIEEVLHKIRETFEKQRLLLDLEESEEKFRTLAEQSSIGILIIVKDIISFANEAITQIFDEPLERVLNNHVDVVYNTLKQEDLSFIHDFLKENNTISEKGVARTCKIITRSGKIKWAVIHPRKIMFKGTGAHSFAIIDVSDELQAKDQLNSLNLDLESKIRERTLELEDANRAKSAFLANMSHELRTPLNAIIGFTEVILKGYVGTISSEQREYINDIFESGEMLLDLINDVLDISKIEAGKMTFLPRDIEILPLITLCLSMFKEKMTRHDITASIDIQGNMMHVFADEVKIKQILFNLLSNAVKFTGDGGQIGIIAQETKKESTLTIWDTGMGISPQDLQRLFQPFERIHQESIKTPAGTGLGLHLTKKLVELHNGRIWVESEPGKGSRFSFAISRKQEKNPSEPDQPFCIGNPTFLEESR